MGSDTISAVLTAQHVSRKFLKCMRNALERLRFFFQAEDGIRDWSVTGVQTCALPISFTAEERNQVTILFGGFTWKHEDLIRAVFQGCGYRCEKLPVPNVAAFQTGKEYGDRKSVV